MHINWYPGHMKKTKDLIVENLKIIDLVIEILDARIPISSENPDITKLAKNKQKVVVLNKVDLIDTKDLKKWEDYFLTNELASHVVALSSEKGTNFAELRKITDKIYNEKLEKMKKKGLRKTEVRAMIVGIPNVGKSSLVNKILGENRVIVSDIEGTTRDAIDTPFITQDDREFVMIDTAGIRRRGKVYEKTEKYSVMRAMRAIERSDVVLCVIDAEVGIREQDKKVFGYAHEAGKGIIIVVNKWDTVEKDNHTMRDFELKIRDQFRYLSYAPILFVSAKTGQRLVRIPEYVEAVYHNRTQRVQSSVLNDVMMDAVATNPAPASGGKRLKVYYGTQVAVSPPTFVVFVNDPELMHFSYERFLENRFRENFEFVGTPIRIIARARK